MTVGKGFMDHKTNKIRTRILLVSKFILTVDIQKFSENTHFLT